jgi:hypothetical protein
MEAQFFAPLQRRIKGRLQAATDFGEAKRAMLEAMDADLVPVRSGRELPPVPHLAVPAGGLEDPVARFARRREREDRFERDVAAQLGRPIPEPAKPERDTLDWQLFGVMREMRFFGGDEPPRHGRLLGPRETFDSKCSR